ncbi:bleomycin resistance protein [Nonomuraea turkmeniaca]|uniref:Bleomycin resistance protein n=1 Tax=Nonomuraea turkmeniaca TaxID=103838 RepID=A0A5S4FG79_9ACTN|nr:VOC family protein [Nonomuraea turkmeniaca]TMR17458.1 bleomycin resistance protein [Nonomuraea turkmeniaca]
MPLQLDVVALGAPEVDIARRFYTTAFSPAVTDDGDSAALDLHGTGQVALSVTECLATAAGTTPATSGFRGYVLTYTVNQPTEVKSVMEVAARGGAEVLKPAKKALFGSFSGAFQAPDGAIWKVAAATGKDTGPAAAVPLPTETTLILGVTAPKASKTFYEAVGMTVDRDYGSKYVDFHPAKAAIRLCLMERGVLARDAGAAKDGDGFPAIVLNCAAQSRDEVDALLAAATAAGGRITAAAAGTPEGGYGGHFTDPDGFSWKVTH